MNNFLCTLCNYSTKRQGNYERHINSNKHTKKEAMLVKNKSNLININLSHNQVTTTSPPNTATSPKKEIFCEYCCTVFTRISSLSRHKKVCAIENQKKKTLEEENKLLNIKLLQYEKDVLRKDEEASHYKDEMNYYKQMLMDAGGLVKKSVSALTYSVKNYSDAPPIKTISVQEIDTFENSEKKIIEDILSAYKHKTLGKYLGDFILKLYKKDDPKTQSIWNIIRI